MVFVLKNPIYNLLSGDVMPQQRQIFRGLFFGKVSLIIWQRP